MLTLHIVILCISYLGIKGSMRPRSNAITLKYFQATDFQGFFSHPKPLGTATNYNQFKTRKRFLPTKTSGLDGDLS